MTREPCGAWEAERLATPAPPAVAVLEATATATPTATLDSPHPALPRGAGEGESRYALDEEHADDIEVVEEHADDIEVVDELEPIDLELAAADDDPFATFIGTLVEVAVEAGCEKAAAILPALLDGGRVMPGVLPASATDALLASGMLARTEGGLVGGEAFRTTAAAWRAILRGDSEDFSSCGSRMLDEWAADLVACLVASPGKTERLRRELRTRGVAAFGLVLAA